MTPFLQLNSNTLSPPTYSIYAQYVVFAATQLSLYLTKQAR